MLQSLRKINPLLIIFGLLIVLLIVAVITLALSPELEPEVDKSPVDPSIYVSDSPEDEAADSAEGEGDVDVEADAIVDATAEVDPDAPITPIIIDTEPRKPFRIWKAGTRLTGEWFGIETITSNNDFDGDGLDDYSDILEGAKIEAALEPIYDTNYYVGGYPPEGAGVCTDVIWRAFRNAGYNLKDMIDNDIAENTEEYIYLDSAPDPNIDFRRVVNMHVWLKRFCISLTIDATKIDEWQPGDIVVYEDDEHIAIISDRRNGYGQPYILHNGDTGVYEADTLTKMNIIGHYRFDSSLVTNSDDIIAWTDN